MFGLAVRSRTLRPAASPDCGPSGGGAIPEFTKLLAQSRDEAMARMVTEARRRGSNAIITMRFDAQPIRRWRRDAAPRRRRLGRRRTATTPNSELTRYWCRRGNQLPHQQTSLQRQRSGRVPRRNRHDDDQSRAAGARRLATRTPPCSTAHSAHWCSARRSARVRTASPRSPSRRSSSSNLEQARHPRASRGCWPPRCCPSRSWARSLVS